MEMPAGKRLHSVVKIIRAGAFSLSFIFLGILSVYGCLWVSTKILGAPPLAVSQSSIFYSDDGSVLGEAANGQKRYWVPISDVSPHYLDAVLSVEDKGFYKHNGFDYKRIAGALAADLKARAKVQGASTITQQYARNLFLTHEKTWYRKAKEAFYTMRIENNYSKDEILEGYINTIYFGHGAYGVQAASRFYFDKDAADLTVSEASMLAGIPKGPSIYSPFKSPERAKERQRVVLHSMQESGYIDEKEKVLYERDILSLNGDHEEQEQVAPYFLQAVMQTLKNDLKLDDQTITLGGLKVYTTLDLHAQEAAEKAFESHFPPQSDIQGALVAMQPKSGEVKALIGGRDYQASSFNRATQAVRQPGSTMKPILYYAALENGFTPATMLKSEATSFPFRDGTSYQPSNFNSRYADKEITLAQAIALSDNIYAVKTHLFLGEKELQKTAGRFGIKSEVDAVPAAALGTSGVKVIEMVNAYSRFANGGLEVEPVYIKRVENYKGDILYEAPSYTEQILDPADSFVMTGMLTGVFNEQLNSYATVTGSTVIPKLTRQYAGKSGSTKADSWMIGFTPQLAAGVWTGYDHSATIDRPAEKQYAKNIWADFMEESLKQSSFKQFKSRSKDIVEVMIDPESGKTAVEGCPEAVKMYFRKGTEPKEVCMLHIHEGETHSEKKNQGKEKEQPWYKKILPFWR